MLQEKTEGLHHSSVTPTHFDSLMESRRPCSEHVYSPAFETFFYYVSYTRGH